MVNVAKAFTILNTCSPQARAWPPRTKRKVERGIKVHTDQKCSACHSIAGKGKVKGALHDVGVVASMASLRKK